MCDNKDKWTIFDKQIEYGKTFQIFKILINNKIFLKEFFSFQYIRDTNRNLYETD